MVKKILIGVMLFFMAVSIPITVPSCGSSSPTGTSTNGTTEPKVNTPTNNYYVNVMVVYLGGLGGCIMGGVAKDPANGHQYTQPVMDAQLTVNDVALDTQGTMYYKMGVATTPGSTYTLKATHGDVEIASGTTVMPSPPVLTAPTTSTITKSQPLVVSWNNVENATAVSLEITYTDTLQLVSDSTVYSSDLLPTSTMSVTVPGPVFTGSGTYNLTLTAFNGIGPGSSLNGIDSTKGYNINGAAGMFIAANPVSDTLYVNYASPKRSIATGVWQPTSKRVVRPVQKFFGMHLQK